MPGKSIIQQCKCKRVKRLNCKDKQSKTKYGKLIKKSSKFKNSARNYTPLNQVFHIDVQEKKHRVLGLWERPDIKFTERIVTKEALNNAIADLPEDKERVQLANLSHEEKLYYIMKEKSELFPHCKSLPSQEITMSHCIKLDEEEKKAIQLTGPADEIREQIGRHINVYQRDRSKDLSVIIDKRRSKLSNFVDDVISLDHYLAKQKPRSRSSNKKNKNNNKKKEEKKKGKNKKTEKKKKSEKKTEIVDDHEEEKKKNSKKRKRQEKRKVEKIVTETEREVISTKEEEEEEEGEEEKVDYKRIRIESSKVKNADKEEDKEEKNEKKKVTVEEEKEEEKKKETAVEEPFRKLPIMIDSLNEKSLRTYELQKSWLQKISIV